MKIFKRHIDYRAGTGTVTLLPEDAEDMWHVYNLIAEGDRVRTTAYRKVTNESATGSTSSQRVTTTLTVEIEVIDYDSHGSVIHLKGRNVQENQHVKLGAYHTLDIGPSQRFTLFKPQWDSMHTLRLDEACDPTRSADVAAVVMQEGLAHVCLITSSMTMIKAKIEVSIPRKKKEFTGQHDKGLVRFFEQVSIAVQRHVDFNIVKCLIIASPGFVRDSFMTFFMEWCGKNGHKYIIDARSKFLLVHSSSGYKHALDEVLLDGKVTARLSDTKAQAEVKALATFHQMLGEDPDRAYYGFTHCTKAVRAQAVETLLISDDLFMSRDVLERKRYVRLVEEAKRHNCTVHIFSVRHVSGEQLKLLSGVAAVLRYPMHDIETSDEEEVEPKTAGRKSKSNRCATQTNGETNRKR